MNDSANLKSPAVLNAIREDLTATTFTMSSDNLTGSLLRTLAASKPRGSLLELGTGAGVSTAWLLDGMDAEATLISVDNDRDVQAIAKRHLGADPRMTFVLADGQPFIESHRQERFDLIFADTWPGKFHLVDEVLAMLSWGGLYIVDDLLPVDSWPPEHSNQVVRLVNYLEKRPDLMVTKLSWSTGLLVAAKGRLGASWGDEAAL